MKHHNPSQLAYGIEPPRFRLPDGSHVGTVRLLVTDLGRSIEYYVQILGLHLHDHALDTATLGTRQDALVSLRTEAAVRKARKGAFGLYHFAILLPERSALGRFAEHVSRLGVRFGMAHHLVSEALYLTDPDGLGIEVYADRPQAQWRQRDRELIMTVDPLDLGNLMNAGGGLPWEGAPSGTTIGHVHLHVGSLQEAEAYYHVGLGFDKTVWTYPGALFLAAGGYHHHLGTNTWAPGPAATENEARLLEWELIVPDADAASRAAQSLEAAGYRTEDLSDGWGATDPWGIRLRIAPYLRRERNA
jgi:catechol 2,3-dioxygenase